MDANTDADDESDVQASKPDRRRVSAAGRPFCYQTKCVECVSILSLLRCAYQQFRDPEHVARLLYSEFNNINLKKLHKTLQSTIQVAFRCVEYWLYTDNAFPDDNAYTKRQFLVRCLKHAIDFNEDPILAEVFDKDPEWVTQLLSLVCNLSCLNSYVLQFMLFAASSTFVSAQLGVSGRRLR